MRTAVEGIPSVASGERLRRGGPDPVRAARRLALREARRSVLRLVNGVGWVLRDASEVVDQTPFEVVYARRKLAVRHYPASAPRLHHVPVLLIPPLMVKPFIFDLVPTRSFVRTLLEAGFSVYLVDFGAPDLSDRHMSLDDYVLDWVPDAVDAVVRHSGAGRLSMVGYCMGGLFALMHASVHQDPRVHAIVTIGSPVDSHEMGLLATLIRVSHEQIDFAVRRLGNIPGALSSSVFRMVSPLGNLTRYAGLALNLWDSDYINDFDALSQWTGNFVDYPGKAFRQLMNDFLVDNKLMDGAMAFGGRVADLSRVTCPLLAFAGASDQIVPEQSVRKVLDLVSSVDKSVRLVPGGHMGMFGGRKAPHHVWQVTAAWLARRDDDAPAASASGRFAQ